MVDREHISNRKTNLIRRVLIIGYSSLFAATILATAIMFPWSVDLQGDESFQPAARSFYENAYINDPLTAKDTEYKESAEQATLVSKTPMLVRHFVAKYGLANKKVL